MNRLLRLLQRLSQGLNTKCIFNATIFVLLLCCCNICSAKTPYTYCFIGDSRFVGMKQTLNTDEDIIWIAKVGATYSWYQHNKYIISNLDRNTVIIYQLGINDLNPYQHIANLQDLQDLGFKHIYFTEVTPVDEYKESLYGYTVSNYQIQQFNNTVRSNLPYFTACINSYNYLLNQGISTFDGLHYQGSTYTKWFYYILNSL